MYCVKKISLFDILGAIPDEDWRRNWICLKNTIMLRVTSKTAIKTIDKMQLHVYVCLRNRLMFKSMMLYLSEHRHHVSLKINKGVIDSHVQEVIEPLCLVNLNLSCNDIGPDGINHFALALKDKTSLVDIDLSRNNIGNYGVAKITQLLLQCKGLYSLKLNFNNLGDIGAIDLSKVVL